ncbi:MAG TPA: POTRA domain-containing protein, partial [Candidatus Dormibacteraeota bacterium]|nr:POTRA domain-containing protein [Candidatus Dormibacteraeota bacterium]
MSARPGLSIEGIPSLAPADTAAALQVPIVPPLDGGAAAGKIIRAIRAKGFVNVDSMVIIRTFGPRVGDPYTREAVRDGVRKLYQSGLYTDVNVVDTVEGDGVTLTVVVQERPRIKGIRFQGAKKIEESKLKAKLTIADGQLLDQGTLELDAGKITEAYAEEGYPRTKVTARTDPSGAGVVQVVFVVDEGPKVKVRDVVFHAVGGGPSFKPGDLRGAMKSKMPGFLRGGTFKPSQLDQDATQLRLFMRSRGYKDADVDSIRPVYTEDGKGVALHVFLREGSRYRFGTASWSGNTVVPTPILTSVTAVQP